MSSLMRRALSREVSIEQLIEIALWLAIPYLIVGIAWAFLHPDHVAAVETLL